jgi:hypothetical protein
VTTHSVFRSRLARVVVSLFGLTVIYVSGVFVREQYGIGMLIQNKSGGALHQVVIKLDDDVGKNRTYPLSDIAPNDRARIYVLPTAASVINLEWASPAGERQTELLSGYVESGYCGNLKVSIYPGSKSEITGKISPVLCKKGCQISFSNALSNTTMPTP